MEKLSLEAIRIDGGTQARVSLREDVVKEYAAHMRDGDTFPPVTVFFDGSTYWLADGFHRYFATKSHGMLEIDAEVREGTQDDAILYAFSANARRGLSMSHEDNKSIIKRIMAHPEWSKWTNTMIAKHIGCSAMTVGRIKKELEPDSKDTVKTYTNKKGTEVKVDTGRLATKKPKEEEPEPEDPTRELTDVINQLTEENTKLKDAVAVGAWDATEIEKEDAQELIADLRNQIVTLEAELDSVKKTRDRYQKENAELIRTVKSLQKKLKGQ